jgi:hypothetical protein
MAVASNSPFTSQILELKEKLDCEELNPFYEPPHNFKIVTVKQVLARAPLASLSIHVKYYSAFFCSGLLYAVCS